MDLIYLITFLNSKKKKPIHQTNREWAKQGA